MSSSDFKTELVRDSRLNIKEEIVYNVHSGPAQSTYQPYTANSNSSSNLTFVVQAPSENVVLSRDILFQATCNFELRITTAAGLPAGLAAGDSVFRYGFSDCFQAFPLNHLVTTATATINNASVSINQKEILPALLRYLDKDKMNKYNCMTPTFLDNYRVYADSGSSVVTANVTLNSNSPFAGYTTSSNSDSLARGCHPLDSYSCETALGAPRDVLVAVNQTYVIKFSATFTEPLFLSPFIFSGLSENPAGLLGLNQLNLNLNIDNTAAAAFCTTFPLNLVGTAGLTYSFKLDSFTSPKLLVNYLSLQPTMEVASKNVVDYIDYSRYLTSPFNTVNIPANSVGTEILLQNVQLSQIPDLILLYVSNSVVTYNSSETFLPIKKVSVNFNNVSGLLSSCSQHELFKMSVRNGCNMNWYEWSGFASKSRPAEANGEPLQIPTVGSVLSINPSADLCLPAMLSNGSSGQFNLQFNITVVNNGAAVAAPQVVMICVNSGIFICNQGTSQIYKALLTMEQVLKTSEESKFITSDNDDSRMIGSGFNKMSHSVSKKGMGRSGGMRQSKLHSFV